MRRDHRRAAAPKHRPAATARAGSRRSRRSGGGRRRASEETQATRRPSPTPRRTWRARPPARAAGAVIADPRASLVALPRGATGVEWGTDLSFVGVYVRALLPGGAAEQSGAVAPGDQLVAIDGDAVFDATFDAAMARLAAVDAEARLEFFRGDRTELLAAVGRRAAAPGAATITVDDRGERREIVVEAGANLRDALVKDGIDVYRGTTAWTNCAGHQMCGTCIVDVVGGAAATNRKSNDEEGTLNLQGCEPSRLSCVTFVYGDVEVRVRPDRDGGFFGSATSGSGGKLDVFRSPRPWAGRHYESPQKPSLRQGGTIEESKRGPVH